MFRKDEDALRRMEEALLAEEAAEQEPEEVPLFEEDEEEELVVRNFANNYKAYSNHRTGVDLEEFSREVYEPRKKRNTTLYLALTAIVLTALIVMALLWWAVRLGLL